MKSHTLFAAALVLIFICTGCNTSLAVTTQNDLAASFTLKTAVTKSVQTVLESFFGAGTENASLFDEAAIRSSLQKANLNVTGIQFPSKTSLAVSGTTKNICTAIPGAKNFITCKDNTMTISITPQNLRQVVNVLPEETVMYLDLLIAPVFTGEEMSKSDYTDLIGIAYGNEMVTDLRKARIQISFSMPGTVTAARFTNTGIGAIAAKGSVVSMNIPLLNLLTDLNGTDCIIEWQ